MSPTGGDTIVARATARGIAAIAMVRVSGRDAVEITSRHFRGADLREAPERTVHVGWIRSSGYEDVDQVVATVFRAPHTVTGEDLVEITCHGGDFVTQRIVEAIVAGGARPAGPGEFTHRAFLNGRIDLAQAEAVAELIHAGSRRAQRISVAHLKGSYSARLSELRNELLDVCALVELELDFSEEDVAFADRARLEEMLARGEALVDRLVRSYRYGLVVRDGISVVIGGRPNAGKSTLLNGFVGYDRAIVAETPGTTRDEIGEETEFDGLRVRFVDTAGLRETIDEIEAEGVRRAEASIRKADVLLYVYDVLVGMEAEEIRFLSDLGSSHPDLTVLLVGNKCDLLRGGVPEARGEREEGRYGKDEAFFISARQAMDEEGIVSPILEAIVRTTRSDEAFDEETDVVTNERHHDHLRRAGVALAAARARLTEGASGDVLALELRTAMNELGAITGATANEDVLDRIFSRFCIGK